MTALQWYRIVEGEPGIFPDPIARVLRALGRLGRRKGQDGTDSGGPEGGGPTDEDRPDDGRPGAARESG